MKYTKKPVTIDAFHFVGEVNPVIEWKKTFSDYSPTNYPMSSYGGYCLSIGTLEGEMVASPGDYIIRGIKGEYYPCKPDIFLATYSPAE